MLKEAATSAAGAPLQQGARQHEEVSREYTSNFSRVNEHISTMYAMQARLASLGS